MNLRRTKFLSPRTALVRRCILFLIMVSAWSHAPAQALTPEELEAARQAAAERATASDNLDLSGKQR